MELGSLWSDGEDVPPIFLQMRLATADDAARPKGIRAGAEGSRFQGCFFRV